MPLRIHDAPPKLEGKSAAGYSTELAKQLSERDSAVRYVEEHKLGQLAGDIMSACLKERPKRARVFVLQYLTARLTAAELASVGLQPKPVVKDSDKRVKPRRDTTRQAALIAKLEKDMAEEKAIQAVQTELGLKPEDVTKYRQCFELVDEDNSGLVGLNEFRKALALCGYSPNQRSLMATFRAVDVDGSGQVDFLEFIRLMRAVDPDQAKKRALEMGIQEDQLEKLREAWKTVDEDGGGSLSLNEMRALVEILGLPAGKSFTQRFKEVAYLSDGGDALGGDLLDNKGGGGGGGQSPQNAGPSRVHEDEQLDFEEFLKVVNGLDPMEELEACLQAGFTDTEKEIAKTCFKQRDPQGAYSLSFERSCIACRTLLVMHMATEPASVDAVSPDDWRNLFNVTDGDKSGEHDFIEFIRFCGRIRELIKMREEADARLKAKEDAELQLTQDEVQNYREMFNKYDRAGRGELPKEAIGNLLKHMGFKAATVQEREELREILDSIDGDGSGTVDFQEFLRLIPALQKKMEEDQAKMDLARAQELGFSEQEHNEFTKVFTDFDEDNSGSLELNEVWGLLKALRRNASYDDLHSLFARIDTDGSGSLEYNEFLLLVKELETNL